MARRTDEQFVEFALDQIILETAVDLTP